jgi:hypothetical protein
MFEKCISIIIGLILINNYYYLGFFVGVNYQIVLSASALLGTLFFVKSIFFFKKSLSVLFFNSVITPIVLLITFFSCLFFFIVPHEQNDIDANDLIRLLILFFYFSWIRLKYYSNELIRWYLIRLSLFSLLINVVLIFFETNFPGVFGLMFKLEKIFDDETWTKRVAGTIGDSNAFGCSLVIYYFFLFNFFLKEKANFLVNLLVLFSLFYLVNLTGSRQSLLIYIFVFFYAYNTINVNKKYKLYSLLFVSLVAFVYIIYSIAKSEAEIDSAITRIFKENEKAEASSVDRWQSILNGFYFSFKNYFGIYGPGSILHNKIWHKQYREYVEVTPHNLFVFLFSQFGIWSLFIIRYIVALFFKAFQKKLHAYAIIFFLLIFFLPNIIYYGITLLMIFYLESYKKEYEQVSYENRIFATIN